MAKLKDITSFIFSRIGSKTGSLSLSPTDEQESYEKIVDNLQSDADITDVNDARYIHNLDKIKGVRKIERLVYSSWDSEKESVYRPPSGFTLLFCIGYANPKTNIMVLDRVYTPSDYVQQSNTQNIVNADASGYSSIIRNNTLTIMLKNAVFYELTGSGGTEYSNSSKINYVIDVYGI